MFRSMMRDFEEDPFFSSHREHMRRMDQMMGNFMSPFDSLFGDMGFPRLMGPENEPYSNNQRQAGGGGGVLMPFGFGRSLFPNMRDMFSNFEQIASDPNCHAYTSSSVFTYTTGEDGAPKVYQASSSTRTAPGGIKETRRTECDSETGYKKMAIGHHIGERAHVIEKAQYGESSQQEETQEFINLDEEDAEHFNREWLNTTRQQPARYGALGSSENRLRRHYIDDEPRALPSPTSRKRENKDPAGKTEKSRRKMLEKLKKKQPKNEN